MKDRMMAIGTLHGDGATGFAARRPVVQRSWGKIWVRVTTIVVIGAVLGFGVYWGLTADTFAVSRVASGSYRYTGQDELQTVLSGFLGRNIWTLSTDEVAAEVTTLPWIRDLRIGRRLPAELEVDFREWRPLLVVASQQDLARPRVLIENGRVLPFPEHLEPAGLAVLVDVPVTSGKTEPVRLDDRHLDAVLDLVGAIEASGLEAVSPVDFVVARDEGYAVVLQDGAGTLQVGRKDFADRLERYMIARDHLERGLTVDLRFADRLTWETSGTTQ